MAYLNTALDYEAVSIVTCFDNHIKNNFYNFLTKFIYYKMDQFFDQNNIHQNNDGDDGDDDDENEEGSKYKSYKKIKFDKKTKQKIRTLINDIFKNEHKSEYNKVRIKIRRRLGKYFDLTKTIMNQINECPTKYLSFLMSISIEMENHSYKPINCFPLRRSVIPKYITLDTTTIRNLFGDKALTKNTPRNEIWKKHVNLDQKIFQKKGYKFAGSIYTDGIGVSILFARQDKYKPSKRMKLSYRKPFGYHSEKYLSSLSIEEKEKLSGRTIVGIDPGKCDLIYATKIVKNKTTNKNETITFRYSKEQRKFETKTRKYQKIDLKRRKKKGITKLEDTLCEINSKTNNYTEFKKYIKEKTKVNALVKSEYRDKKYRKRRLNRFINTQRSEQKMINSFKEKMGSPNEVLIAMGDWDQKSTMKFQEPTKGKSMRTLFRKNGFKLYLIDECSTSKYSCANGKELEKFLKRRNPRPYRKNVKLCHGLLRYKNGKEYEQEGKVKLTYFNRDLNGSKNILIKGIHIMANKGIPKYMSRKNNNSAQ